MSQDVVLSEGHNTESTAKGRVMRLSISLITVALLAAISNGQNTSSDVGQSSEGPGFHHRQ